MEHEPSVEPLTARVGRWLRYAVGTAVTLGGVSVFFWFFLHEPGNPREDLPPEPIRLRELVTVFVLLCGIVGTSLWRDWYRRNGPLGENGRRVLQIVTLALFLGVAVATVLEIRLRLTAPH
ncbi:MAG TPA: hypothetical protein VMB50_14585 [Myxococcales bacterium]|nr:hypothetical protein [Myxococcales bacterium]